MTMLMQWLQILVPAAVLWFSVAYFTVRENHSLLDQPNPFVQLILLLPFLSVIALGLYSVATVLWKTYNFNDCKDAAAELQKEISEAKEYLKKNKVLSE